MKSVMAKSKANLTQLLTFALVGVANTAFCGALIWLFTHAALHHIPTTALSYGAAICLSFALNRKLTFKNPTKAKTRLIRFFAVCLTLMGVVQLIQITMIDIMGTEKLPAFLTGMMVYTLLGFLIHKHYTFK